MSAIPIVTCSACATTRPGRPARDGGLKTPRGWQVLAGRLLCATCAREAYQLRALSMTVAGVVDGAWPDLNVALQRAWVDTTAASNWIATELYRRDRRRGPGETRLLRHEVPYLYPEVRTQWPALPPQTVVSLAQSVTQGYQRRRIGVLWRGDESLRSYRFPQPIPIHNQSWEAVNLPGGARGVRARLGDRWWTLRLAVTSRDAPAHAGMVTGEIKRGTLTLWRLAKHSEHATGPTRRTRLMVTIAGWLPRPASVSGEGILEVVTGTEHLLRIGSARDRVVISGDQVRRRVIGHERTLARLQGDLGVTCRWVASERQALARRFAGVVERHRRYMRSNLQMIAAQVMTLAQRRHCAIVRLDDECGDFCERFPWHQLRAALIQAGVTRGIRVEIVRAVPGDADDGDRSHDPEVEVGV